MTRELKVRRVLIVRAGESRTSANPPLTASAKPADSCTGCHPRARWPRLGRVMSELEASTRVKIKVRDPNGRTGAGQKSVDVSGCGGARLRAHPIEELLAAEVVRLYEFGGWTPHGDPSRACKSGWWRHGAKRRADHAHREALRGQGGPEQAVRERHARDQGLVRRRRGSRAGG